MNYDILWVDFWYGIILWLYFWLSLLLYYTSVYRGVFVYTIHSLILWVKCLYSVFPAQMKGVPTLTICVNLRILIQVCHFFSFHITLVKIVILLWLALHTGQPACNKHCISLFQTCRNIYYMVLVARQPAYSQQTTEILKCWL